MPAAEHAGDGRYASMSMRVSFCKVLAACCLAAAVFTARPVWALDPPKAVRPNGCQKLQVLVVEGNLRIFYAECRQGIKLEATSKGVLFKQSGGEDIDCELRFHGTKPDGSSVVTSARVMQNLCALKAGNIRVEFFDGQSLPHHAREGSFADSRPGVVRVWSPKY
jgi:hypothetical protein